MPAGAAARRAARATVIAAAMAVVFAPPALPPTRSSAKDSSQGQTQHHEERRIHRENGKVRHYPGTRRQDHTASCQSHHSRRTRYRFFGHQPVRPGIHAPPARSGVKAQARTRPHILWRRSAEPRLVAGLRACIPVLELHRLRLPTTCGAMMQRLAQHLTTQPLPIRTRIDQMQVPRLIHRLRRRHRMPRTCCQENESAVLLHHALCELPAPAILLCQPFAEAQRRARLIEFKRTQSLPKRIAAGFHTRHLSHHIQTRQGQR